MREEIPPITPSFSFFGKNWLAAGSNFVMLGQGQCEFPKQASPYMTAGGIVSLLYVDPNPNGI